MVAIFAACTATTRRSSAGPTISTLSPAPSSHRSNWPVEGTYARSRRF